MDVARPEAILIVDDDDLYVRALTRQLRSLGFPFVFRASSADQALAMLDHVRPSVVLTDMVMEERDSGMRVIESARRVGASCAVLSGLSGLDEQVVGAPVRSKVTLETAHLEELLGSLIEEKHRRSRIPKSAVGRVA